MTRRADSPKILVISNWAPPMIGGPKNLYNLFSLFPRDSYVILTSANAIDPRSAATGFWLQGKYVYFDRRGGGRRREAKHRPEKETGYPSGAG